MPLALSLEAQPSLVESGGCVVVPRRSTRSARRTDPSSRTPCDPAGGPALLAAPLPSLTRAHKCPAVKARTSANASCCTLPLPLRAARALPPRCTTGERPQCGPLPSPLAQGRMRVPQAPPYTLSAPFYVFPTCSLSAPASPALRLAQFSAEQVRPIHLPPSPCTSCTCHMSRQQ